LVSECTKKYNVWSKTLSGLRIKIFAVGSRFFFIVTIIRIGGCIKESRNDKGKRA